jgi:hypothetical protein
MTRYLFFVVTYFDGLKQMDGRRPFGDITNTLNRRKLHSQGQHDNQAVQNGMFVYIMFMFIYITVYMVYFLIFYFLYIFLLEFF